MNTCLQGLYLLADESILPFSHWANTLPACLDAGVRLVQYRGKQQSASQQQDHAGQLLHWCRERAIPLLVNDDPALCRALDADGVHLGRDDGALRQARAQLGPHKLLGHSCYNDLARAREAVAAGADYVSFGRLFPSDTKPQASPASLAIIQQAAAHLSVPICGIGGITVNNAIQVRQAGADLLCVGGGILAQDQAVAVCQKLATIAG